MGAQLTKGGVAVEGKAAGDSAAAKTNGQVSILAGRHAYMHACFSQPASHPHLTGHGSIQPSAHVSQWLIRWCVSVFADGQTNSP